MRLINYILHNLSRSKQPRCARICSILLHHRASACIRIHQVTEPLIHLLFVGLLRMIEDWRFSLVVYPDIDFFAVDYAGSSSEVHQDVTKLQYVFSWYFTKYYLSE